MNKISLYRAERNLSRSALAAEWGVTAEAIRLVEAGLRQFSPRRAIAIEGLTGGRLTCADIRPDLFKGREPADAAQQSVGGNG